jgi:hypothetical protein
MPGRRPCSICIHPRRQAIELVWIKGEIRKNIAARFEISFSALNHHYNKGHVRRDMAQAARQARESSNGVTAGLGILNSLEEYLQRINKALATTDRILLDSGDDPGVQLATIREQMTAIREATRLLELGGKLTGELDQTKYNLYVMPQWTEIRDVILAALEGFPEARQAIMTAVTARLSDRAAKALPVPFRDTDDAIVVEATANNV